MVDGREYGRKSLVHHALHERHPHARRRDVADETEVYGTAVRSSEGRASGGRYHSAVTTGEAGRIAAFRLQQGYDVLVIPSCIHHRNHLKGRGIRYAAAVNAYGGDAERLLHAGRQYVASVHQ